MELELVNNSKLKRRMMRIPRSRSEPCPLRTGHCYRLRCRGMRETLITVIAVRETLLSALTEDEARREGFGTIQGANDALRRRWDVSAAAQWELWAVGFVRGDATGFMAQAQPLLLAARRGDYTTEPSLAMRGEPEVLMPSSDDLRRTRQKELEDRILPQRRAAGRAKAEAEKLLASMTSMKQRNRLKLVTKTLDKVLDDLPVPDGDTVPGNGERAEHQVDATSEGGLPV